MAAELLFERECQPRQEGSLDLRVVEFNDEAGVYYPIIMREGSDDPVIRYLQNEAKTCSNGYQEDRVILSGECLGIIQITRSEDKSTVLGHITKPFSDDTEARWWDFVRTPATNYQKEALIHLSRMNYGDFLLVKKIFFLRDGVFQGLKNMQEFRQFIEDEIGSNDDLDDYFVDLGQYLKEIYS